MKLIYDKETLKFVGVIQENTNYEWELKHNVIPNFGKDNYAYEVIETDVKTPKLIKENGELKIIENAKTETEIEIEEFRNMKFTTEEILDTLVENGIELKGDVKSKYDNLKYLKDKFLNK